MLATNDYRSALSARRASALLRVCGLSIEPEPSAKLLELTTAHEQRIDALFVSHTDVPNLKFPGRKSPVTV